jgi:hypothetical protein
MPSPFDTLTPQEAKRLIPAVDPVAKQAELFYKGDHWQDTAGWVGPIVPKNDKNYSTVEQDIKRAFASKNAVREIINRHTGGVIGREPMWRLVPRRPIAPDEEPTEEENNLIAEAETLLTQWWQDKKVHTLLKDSLPTLLTTGRRVYRLFIPRGRLQEDGTLPSMDISEALRLIFLDTPDIDKAAVGVNRDYMEEIGVYSYTEKPTVGSGQKTSTGKQWVEITYRDDEGNTVLRQAQQQQTVRRQTGNSNTPAPTTDQPPANDPVDPEAVTIPMGGHLWMFEITRQAIATEQVLQNQKLLNMALTMLGRNTVQGGFLERIILNGQPPQTTELDPVTGTTKTTPLPFQTGAGTTNFISGIVAIDPATGKPVIGNPSVVYRDPVTIETFVGAREEAYRVILEETHQLHALISGDAVASGESRIQARSDFLDDLDLTAPQINNLLTWLLEAVLYLASYIGGTGGRYESLRAMVEVRPSTGPLSADEQRIVLERYEKGTLSRENAMSLLGTDDVDGELSKMKAERESSIEYKKAVGEVAQLFDDLAGVSQEVLEAAGFDEDTAKVISEGQQQREPNTDDGTSIDTQFVVTPNGRELPAPQRNPR